MMSDRLERIVGPRAPAEEVGARRVRYLLPIGPLRLDVGFNPDARDGEDDYVIHLSVGMAF